MRKGERFSDPEPEQVDYRSWSKADLVSEARRRNLATSGNKQDRPNSAACLPPSSVEDRRIPEVNCYELPVPPRKLRKLRKLYC